MQLKNNEIHIWFAHLSLTPEQEEKALLSLSLDECVRANRFHFPIHRQRFIAARSALRDMLGMYLSEPPQNILFSYTEHDKPYLTFPDYPSLAFNLSHSEDRAVYAFTLDALIGIDIEKVKNNNLAGIAKKFFSPRENEALIQLDEAEQTNGFYKIWSRKEALVKAVGRGLSIPLSSFSVGVNDQSQIVHLENETWSLHALSLHADYQAAVASNQKMECISIKHNKFYF